jgi:hypothetical protein
MIHLILQGKGGVGKTFVSSMLTQFLKSKYETVVAFDTDSVNPTFSQYEALGVTRVDLMDGSTINERNLDEMLETILTPDEDDKFPDHVVVDNGASSFVPFSNYLVENEVIEMLKDAGQDVMVHTVLEGGQGMNDTLQGLNVLAKYFNNIYVWQNQYYGTISYEGKKFEETKVYQNNEEKIYGVAVIGDRSKDTFGKDIELMLKYKLSFDEVKGDKRFKLMSKQRLNIFKKDIYGQLDNFF